MVLPGGMGKVSWLEKVWESFPKLQTLLQSLTEPLKHLLFQLPWLTPAGIPPAPHYSRDEPPAKAPGWVWVIVSHRRPLPDKIVFSPLLFCQF